ncbi:MAG: DegQ family serine endoprotease [Gammaproteobacteria bacterium]|nr:DegQ family serine endoprotease [Gammaproteobacteria bacterium]MBU1654130.1 DegQ family serine endoprotease [Gammaproteobacteria bacterium]MBU1960146.1 DegQ family serine endoprotease [Gammaproteobacteria bacterium]
MKLSDSLRFHPLVRNRCIHAPLLALAALVLWSLAATGALARELPDFTQLAKQYGPAVVNISTRRNAGMAQLPPHFSLPDMPEGSPLNELFRHFFGMPGGPGGPGKLPQRRSLGSGFIIAEDGYVITNHHVVKDADEIVVNLNDRREFKAEVVGSDPNSDIALLKISAKGLPTVKVSRNVEVEVGEWVLAIGSPFGFDHTVTAGIVSAKGRSLPDETYVPFIQTDVAINPGNSGGPLFNLNGEVVGVNSQIYSRSGGFMGLSFAIPMDVAMNVVDQLRATGHVTMGWLGVYIQDLTRELAESFGMDKPKGALVAKVTPGSPAEQAGLLVGDVILSYNGKELENSAMLPHLVGRTAVGEKAELEVLRQGKTQKIPVTIGKLPQEEQIAAQTQPQGPANEAKLGLAVRDLTPQERAQLEIKQAIGVLVTQVSMGPAASAGVMVNDVILMIDGKPVANAAALRQLVAALPPGRSVAVLVQRDNGTRFLPLRIPKK